MEQQISLGGRQVRGFGLAAAGDPDIWSSLSAAQQAWVFATLATLNQKIVTSTASMCPGWVTPSGATGVTAAAGCFQMWFNGIYQVPGSPVKALRTDGVFDQDTLAGLQTIAGLHPADFTTPYPASSSKLSKGEMIGLGVAGAAVLGGGVYLVTHKKKSSRKRRK